jgi:hypothetical protein
MGPFPNDGFHGIAELGEGFRCRSTHSNIPPEPTNDSIAEFYKDAKRNGIAWTSHFVELDSRLLLT